MIATPLVVVGVLAMFLVWVLLAWWALFRDRARGRRRCPRCWYDLAHSPTRTCPECGYRAATEKKLYRTRRRWRLGIAAIVAGVLQGLFVAQHVQQRGWASSLPTPVLAWLGASPGSLGMGALDELERRGRAGTLSTEGWEHALAASARAARVRSDGSWHGGVAGRLGRRAGEILLNEPDPDVVRRARARLLELSGSVPPLIEIERDAVAWPDLPATMDVRVVDSLAGLLETRIVVEVEDGATSAWILRDEPIQPRSFGIRLPPRSSGVHEIDVAVRAERRPPPVPEDDDADADVAATPARPERLVDPDPEWMRVTGGGVRRVRLEVRDEPRPFAPVEDDPELDALIAQVFGAGLVQWDTGSLPVRVRVNRRPTYVEPLEDVAIGLRVELLRNGRLGRRLDLWWRGGRGGAIRGQSWEVPFHDDAVLLPPADPGDEWVLRVRGDRTLAARIEDASRWWAGEIEVPVRVRTQRGNAPPRGWVPVEIDDDAEDARPAADASFDAGPTEPDDPPAAAGPDAG